MSYSDSGGQLGSSDSGGQLETALASASSDPQAAAAADLSTTPAGDLSATSTSDLTAALTADLTATPTRDLTTTPTSDLIGPNDLTPMQVAATASGQNMRALVSWVQSVSSAVPHAGISANMVLPALLPATHALAPHHMARAAGGPGSWRVRPVAVTVMPSAAVGYSSPPGLVARTGTAQPSRAVVRHVSAAGDRHARAAPPASMASMAWSPRTVIALDSGGSAAGAGGGVGSGMTAMAIFMALGLGLLELFSSRLSLELEPWRSAVFPSRLERPG